MTTNPDRTPRTRRGRITAQLERITATELDRNIDRRQLRAALGRRRTPLTDRLTQTTGELHAS